MISVHFQGNAFNIIVIQVYAPTSNAKDAELTGLMKTYITWSINKIKHLWHMKHHTRCWSPAYSMTTGTLKSNRYKLLTGNYKRNESNKVQMQIHRSVVQKNRKTSLLRCQRNLCRSQTKVFITYSIQKLNLQIQAFWARKTKWPVCPMNEWVKG